MATETFTVIALPHSARNDAAFHVSLFIAPRLVPDGATGKLADFDLFVRWGKIVAEGIKIELLDQDGPIECAPKLQDFDPEIWAAMFPETTPVVGPAVPAWQERTWRTFDTKLVTDLAKINHLATIFSAPTATPAPTEHPLAGPILAVAAESYSRWETNGQERRLVYDESLMTAQMDEQTQNITLEQWADLRSRDRSNSRITTPAALVGEMAVQLHRVRRFYERPESEGEYRARPDPDAVTTPLESPEPEFHERCAMAGDHPALLRRLGLVIDLEVADPTRLETSKWLSAQITVEGDRSAHRSTRVFCQVTRDGALLSVPNTQGWHSGALRLGDETRFFVLDVDTDGSALKTERFMWTLPRLAKVADNGDPADAATPALRSTGFTVARLFQALTAKRRLDTQTELDALLQAGKLVELHTEDVTRGMRVEVFDDLAGSWSSLHQRLTDVVVTGHGKVLDDLPEEGFIQGTTAHETPGVDDSPVHVHEAMFGWEGWSLSAPRPGKRIRNDGPDEIVEDTPTEPIGSEAPPHPITITNEVAPGTLPRLRYGRNYSFRAWAVDLAGNSRPHLLNPPTTEPSPELEAALAALAEGEGSPVEAGEGVRDLGSVWAAPFRVATNAVLETRRLNAGTRPETVPVPDELRDLVTDRLLARRIEGRALAAEVARPPGAAAVASRRVLVEQAFATAVGDLEQPFVVDPALRSAVALSPVVASHIASLAPGAPIGEIAEPAVATVTAPRPFLRWDPVSSPAVVPLDRYTEGESLRVLVVRSGVTQDPDTLELTVSSPDDYAAAVTASHPELDLRYEANAQRHLAPPKTSQIQAELHGMFDEGIGSDDPDAHQKMLGWVLREDGSFLDQDRADIDNPPDRIPQPGVRLEIQSGVPQVEPKSFPLPVGEPPAPGQYVVHDTPDLALPYLPDPMAHGISLVFPEAGRDRTLLFPFGGEGFTAPYGGTWPEIEPFRFVLAGGGELGGDLDGRVLTLRLPPGDLQRFRLSSCLDRANLKLLGPWRSLPPIVATNQHVIEAAVDGWLWGLTPSEDVLLVHAVPRPLEAPRPTLVRPLRARGQVACILFGAVDVHGPSTDSLIAHAAWTDPVDELTATTPGTRQTRDIAFQTEVRAEEDLAGLGAADIQLTFVGLDNFWLHRAIHQFPDTHHRMVTYRFRATTRFREYFHPDLLAPDPDIPDDDGRSVIGQPVVVDVPSSAPPAAPIVHSVIPLFRWDRGEEAEQPMARRHVRRAGVRIYLERPWFSSGEGELLGVLLAPFGKGDDFGSQAEGQSGFPFVSKAGTDPMWVSDQVPTRPAHLLQLDNFLRVGGLDDRPEPGRPVARPIDLPLEGAAGKPTVSVVGYRPQYNVDRQLWYVDVALDMGTAFWPFVRLAVCRYQPSSVAGCHLSAPVQCDYVQLPPDRTTSVSRTDASHVKVIVSGPVGARGPGGRGVGPIEAIDHNRLVVARLQRRDPAIDTDLGWETVTTETLQIRGFGANEHEAAWVGELAAGEQVTLRRPGVPAEEAMWRVTVEEWEKLPGDRPAGHELPPTPVIALFPIWEQRLVHADEVLL